MPSQRLAISLRAFSDYSLPFYMRRTSWDSYLSTGATLLPAFASLLKIVSLILPVQILTISGISKSNPKPLTQRANFIEYILYGYSLDTVGEELWMKHRYMHRDLLVQLSQATPLHICVSFFVVLCKESPLSYLLAVIVGFSFNYCLVLLQQDCNLWHYND